jgi:hypothetical protein
VRQVVADVWRVLEVQEANLVCAEENENVGLGVGFLNLDFGQKVYG